MSGVDLKPSEVLSKAADLIEPEGAWARHQLAKSAHDQVVNPTDERAVCWCMAGAMQRITPVLGNVYYRAHEFVARSLDIPTFASWNDAPGRTQAEVVKALRDAAELARSEGQ